MAEKFDLGKNICSSPAKSVHRPRTISGVVNIDTMNHGIESKTIRRRRPTYSLGKDAHAFDVSTLREDSLDEASNFSRTCHGEDYARRRKNPGDLFDELALLSSDEIDPKCSGRLK